MYNLAEYIPWNH